MVAITLLLLSLALLAPAVLLLLLLRLLLWPRGLGLRLGQPALLTVIKNRTQDGVKGLLVAHRWASSKQVRNLFPGPVLRSGMPT